ncbi:MFS transporter [Bacillus ndiopicus]|uniref:MFS transporter n=1 Tax=Bacillus ndiopicus TaxID=1347368 RepID=UPI0005AB5CAA|nr:tetracycline resistance MFS efflux pump [Bacillus ndiopicus]
MNKAILLLVSVQFFVYVGFGLIIPVLPEVVVKQDFHPMHVGGLLTIYSLASFFTAPLWGRLSDKVGRKKLILVGLLGFSASFMLVSVFIHSLPMLYASRIVGGLFSGALYTAVTGFIGDISTEENRNKYMGFMGMSIGLGFIFGPAIGGLLGEISLRAPFTVSAILIFALFFYALAVLKEPDTYRKTEGRAIIPMAAGQLFSYRIRYLFIFSFLVTFLLAGIESTLQLFQMDAIQITSAQIGSLFLFSGFVDFFIQGMVVRKVKDGQEPKWLMAAQIITAIGLFMLPFTNSLMFAGAALCVFTAGNALARTLNTSLASKESGGLYGTAAGVIYSMDSLGRIIGPLFFTWLLTVASGKTYYLSASIAFASIILLWIFQKSIKSLRQAK